MDCDILIDAMRDLQLKGKVDSVSEYPIPSISRYTAHIKEYATEIVITDPPPGVRTGMTAKVTIRSEQIDRALQIPLTAIFRVDGESFCLVGNEDDEMQIRSIELGSNNMIMAVVKSGLEAGERIVLNPDHFKSLFKQDNQNEIAQK